MPLFQGFSDYLFKWYMDKGTVLLTLEQYSNLDKLFCLTDEDINISQFFNSIYSNVRVGLYVVG